MSSGILPELLIVKRYLFVETIPPWEYNKNEIFMQMKRGVGI
jgi:hypothetical protein|nr:MAG TPA: hypothetical protein [Caudoviricetes sp.]